MSVNPATSLMPTKTRRRTSDHKGTAPASNAERERLARNLAEAIDDLCRHDAAAQFERAFSLEQLSERQRNEEGH
jgi:hypothetical protein